MGSNMIELPTYTRPRVEHVATMPGAFPMYQDTTSDRSPISRPDNMNMNMSMSMNMARPPMSDTTDNSSAQTTQSSDSSNSRPLKGILKKPTSPTRTSSDGNPLAARFYRVPRPEDLLQSPTMGMAPGPVPLSYIQQSPYHNRGWDSDPESTVSGSSELSVNTQATSVASDVTMAPTTKTQTMTANSIRQQVNSAGAAHVRQVRRVPSLVGARTKVRLPSASPRLHHHHPSSGSEVSWNSSTQSPSTASTSPTPKRRRSVQIQILPSASNNNNNELQVARQAEKDLLSKIEALEAEARGLRDSQARLGHDLDDAEERLAARVQENKELQRAVTRERTSKEQTLRELEDQRRLVGEVRSGRNQALRDLDQQRKLVGEVRAGQEQALRDLEQQRKLVEESRSNVALQRGWLKEAESQRDSFHRTCDELEARLAGMQKRMDEKDAAIAATAATAATAVTVSVQAPDVIVIDREQEEAFVRQVNLLERAASTLEERIRARELEVRDLTSERDVQLREAEEHKDQVKRLTHQAQDLAEEVKVLTSDRNSLLGDVEDHQHQVKRLTHQIYSLVEDVKVLVETRNTLKQKNAGLEKEQQKLRARVQDVEEEKGGLLTVITGLEEQIVAVKAQTSELEAAKKGLEERIEVFKIQTSDLEAVKSGLQEQVTTFKTQTSDLEAAKKDLEDQLQTKKILEDQFQAEKKEKQDKYDNLLIQLAGSKNAAFSLASEKLALDTELVSVKANLVTVQGDLNRLREEHGALQGDNEQLRLCAAELDTKNAELNKLTTQYSELEQSAKDLQTELDKRQKQIKSLQTQRDRLVLHVKDLEDGTAHTKLQARNAELEDRVKPLQALETQIQNLQAEADKVAGLTQDKTVLEARIQTLQAEASKAAAVAREKEADHETRAQQLRIEMDAKVAHLMSQNQGLTGQLAAASQQLDQSKTTVRELQAVVARMQSRTQSRSSSRRPSDGSGSGSSSKKSHERSRSTTGLMFVRSSQDKAGSVYVTTRDSLHVKEDK